MRKAEAKYTQLIGKSPAIQELRRLICCAADSTVNVLISGETGTGKELAARTIHAQSKRQSAPFVPILCNAYPETLIEAELFGYEEGAFTDAKRAKPGMFELAQGGTLFLDEIAEMSQVVQVKLLRGLEHLTITRIGGTEPIQIDTRLIAATNKDLQQLIESGSFREDLFYRLCVFEIEVPPLREHAEDIPLLAEHYLSVYNSLRGRDVIRITEDAMDCLQAYNWPGNVRELQNVLEGALVQLDGDVMTLADLPDYISKDVKHTVLTKQEMQERDRIQQLLIQTGGNISETARRLGLTRQALYRRLKKYGIER